MTNSNASLAVRAAAELELRKRRAAVARAVDYADLRILTKKLTLEPLTFNRVQQHLLDNLTGRDLILKPRQVGISTAVQARLFLAAIRSTARIGVLAHDMEGTKKLRDMSQLFYDQLPANRQPARDVNNATRTYYPDTHSMIYINTAGSRQGGRAGTYSHVHGSEVAFWKDAPALMAGLLQGVPTDGEIILESTPNGAQGWFYERCLEAWNAQQGDGESAWTLHFYAWWWDDGYALPLTDGEEIALTSEETRLCEIAAAQGFTLTPQQIKWRRAKQRELGALFPQEYPEDPIKCFLTKTGSLFNPTEIEVIDYAPECVQTVRFYDLAVTEKKTADYTAGVKMGLTTDNRPVILHMWRKQQQAPDVHKAIVQNAKLDGKSVPIRLEAEKAGIVELQYMMRDPALNGYVLDKKSPLGDKYTRAIPFATRVNAGEVMMVRGTWNQDLLAELRDFPNGAHDDQVDALSGAWDMLANVGSLSDWDILIV